MAGLNDLLGYAVAKNRNPSELFSVASDKSSGKWSTDSEEEVHWFEKFQEFKKNTPKRHSPINKDTVERKKYTAHGLKKNLTSQSLIEKKSGDNVDTGTPG